MRLLYNSTFYKITSVLRFFIVKIFYLRKFKCPELSMIGTNCGIHIFKSGSIHCKGRIIINDQAMLYAKGKLIIGEQFYTNRYTRIVAHEKIEIGRNVTLGQMVSILDHDHNYIFEGINMKLNGYITEPVKIGNNVWLGDKCTVLKGVTIGNNVVAGANTLIHKDVPSNSVIGGVPFKILKSTKPEENIK